MSSSDVIGLSTLNGATGPGRPTKRTKKIIAEILEAVSAGAPLSIACQAAGISAQTLQEWRRRDPALALEVDQAAARGTVSRLKEIGAQGKDGAWQALSWLVERRHPAEFARPEVALNVGIQNNLNAQGGNGISIESIVLSDLDFLKLREHEAYEHRNHAREAREVPGEITVEPGLSGSLVRSDHPGSAIVSESQQEENERRVERSRKKIEALLAAKFNKPSRIEERSESDEQFSNSGELVSGPIELPVGLATPEWWKRFVQGDPTRLVSKEAATWVCKEIGGQVLGSRAGNTPVEFQGDAPISEVLAALEKLCGIRGWQQLNKKAGMA